METDKLFLAKRTTIALVLLTATMIASVCQAKVVTLDRIVAVVDNGVVLQSELDQQMRLVKSRLANAPAGQIPPEKALEKQVLNHLIIERLELQMANRAGILISDEELNHAMASIAKQNHLTLPQFRQEIAKEGMSYVEMRDQIRQQMKISQVQQGVMHNRIKITDQEVKDFLASDLGKSITADEYRLGHILLPLPEDANAEQITQVRNEADDLMKKLKAGADFKTLAIEKSKGQNALSGGDLGWRKAVQLPTMFSDIVPKMKVGDVRGPIKSASGFHIIKLVAKRGAQAQGQVKQTDVRQVLIEPSEIRTDQEALDLARNLRQQVVNGKDFADVARLYSNDPGSALSGGDLGWNPAGTFSPEFEKMMGKMKIDEISPVFKTAKGYHFLQVTGRRVQNMTQKFKKNQAENYLRNQKFDDELESWIREIRDDAYVDIRI